MRRVISLVLTASTVLTVFAFSLTASADQVYTGKCGDNATYEIVAGDGVDFYGSEAHFYQLEIKGTGDIYDYPGNGKNLLPSARQGKSSYFEKVVIDAGITGIGAYAFSNALFQTSNIIIPGTVKRIGKGAFEGCSRIGTLKIPYGTERIEDRAFDGCGWLFNVNLPSTVKKLGSGVFSGTDVTEIYYQGSQNEWNKIDVAKQIADSQTTVHYNSYGLQYRNNVWVYLVNNETDTSFTGVANNQNGWWYIKNGKVDFTYTGLASNDFGCWYVKKGKVDFSFNGMAYGQDGWRYVKNGKVDESYTGMGYNAHGWWYFKDGKVDFNYTGLAENSNGCWYFKSGKIDFKFNGMVYGKAGGRYAWRYVKNGKVDFTYTGMAYNSNGWWYFKDGDVDFTYTGMAYNSNGWWYFNNGRVDFAYTGFAQNSNGWWYFKDGRIDFNFNGMAYGKVNGQNAWRYVKNGKVDLTYTGMAYNSNGWWYFKDGNVDFNYTGLASNQYGRWYFRNGRIDFNYNGNVKDENGYWVVTNGKVNTSATWKYNYALPTPAVADTSGDWKLLLVNRDYSLPSNYLNNVKLVYVCNSSERLDSRAAVEYEKMYNAAAKEGIYLTPCSGYRSYDLQKRNFENRINANINSGYSKINATIEASKVILPPGTSEHNAGLAMDIISVQDSFEYSSQYKWLCQHAQDYGFILRYPKDKQNITKIVFEPWHWRYVGVDAAKAMKSSGKCLEEYLGKA